MSSYSRAMKKVEKEQAIKKQFASREDVQAFERLQQFYKDHPFSTPSVKEVVDQIRKNCDSEVQWLQDKFDRDHQAITAKYIRQELDYVESYLLPDQKVDENMTGVFKKLWKWITGRN